ncbi:MAG: GAF domain-containing protein [Acaryochloridaceae cyanobacterium SU_2_1]|nr:GAF domain-containing protein [Acaryochloridaceae cyanobacterium SU_2_1]
MSESTSFLHRLLDNFPHLRSQMYFKSSLNALCRAIEDVVLASPEAPLVIASFQRERFYRQESRRYQRIAQQTNQVYVLATPEPESSFALAVDHYETIPLDAQDPLAQEKHLVIISSDFTACLVGLEQQMSLSSVEQAHRYEGIWTFERQVSLAAARLLLDHIVAYRPELAPKVAQAKQQYDLALSPQQDSLALPMLQSRVFGQRLVTYLQASQYKLLKAYRALSAKERKERFANAMTAAIRQSLDPKEVLAVAVHELGQVFEHCRCILYCCTLADEEVEIEYEFVPPGLESLQGKPWPISTNPLLSIALAQERAIAIPDISAVKHLRQDADFAAQLKQWQIKSWLIAPIRHQGSLLGVLELHHVGPLTYPWHENDIALVEAISAQAGVALTQAQAFTDSESLNRNLAALEQTRSNLIAIVGHELRTPLSTIQVCLESLDSEPDISPVFRQVLLSTALEDLGRLRNLIQDILILSRLEGGQIYNQTESIEFAETLELALSSLNSSGKYQKLPKITVNLDAQLPTIQVDGEGLEEVLNRLLDNACKFTEEAGEVTIAANIGADQQYLEVMIADTGRGIEPTQLETIFDSFYQEEDFLRRSTGGTGLGLAICRQVIQGMHGQIWAESPGRGQGSTFHFTLPLEVALDLQDSSSLPPKSASRGSKSNRSKSRTSNLSQLS